MPRVEAYENNDGQAQVGAANLLSMIGQAKGVTGGWSGFALKSILVSTSAATVWGLASWMLFHGPLGPALSFLGGSGFGFVGGLVSRWRTDTAEALHLVDMFPRLMEHHVRVGECGRELEGRDFGEWARNLRSSPRKQGVLIAAMYSAAPALDRIRQEKEEALVAAYAAREAEAVASVAEADGQR